MVSTWLLGSQDRCKYWDPGGSLIFDEPERMVLWFLGSSVAEIRRRRRPSVGVLI